MKKYIIVCVIALLGVGFSVSADFVASDWNYYKDILKNAEGLMLITPDTEMYAKSNSGLSDIRIVDDNNKEIPYKFVTVGNKCEKQELQVRLINNSVAPGKYTTAILDLEKRGVVINNLNIKTSTENFQRSVVVYGSDDKINWNVLKSESYMYDFTDKVDNVKSQKLNVHFPESIFQYYKVEIADLDNKPVIISSASVSQYSEVNQELVSVSVDSSNGRVISQNASNKSTEVTVDIGHGGFPVSMFKLNAKNQNFNRRVLLFSTNDNANQASWRQVGQGYIFNYNTAKFVSSSYAIDITPSTDRYFKIIIFNNDDAPLEGLNVSMFMGSQRIAFQSKMDNDYRIFYGNNKARNPQYDIEKYFQYLDLESARQVSLGLEKTNSSFVAEVLLQKPFTERYPYFITIALSLSGIILLLMVYKFMKNS